MVRHDSQERLQISYIALNHALPWFHPKASDMEHEDYTLMLKKVRFSKGTVYLLLNRYLA